MQRQYKNISPTAYFVAYARSLSDLPLAKDIFEEMEVIGAKAGADYKIDELMNTVDPAEIPMFEARFKLANRLLNESGIDQVLEIAAGFSQRGIVMARNPSIEYAELDLPEIMPEKIAIVKNLMEAGKVPEEPNLHLNEGNALIMRNLLSAVRNFEDKPIAVVNEGLLRYLNREERAIVAKNIYQLLKKFGGVWITPDTCLQTKMKNPQHISPEASDEKVKQLTGVDVVSNFFKNADEAVKFFEEVGFTVERHSFMEAYGELVTPGNLNLPPEKVQEVLKQKLVLVMRIK